MGRMLDDVDARNANPAAGGQRAGGGNGDGGCFAGAVGAQKAEDLALPQLQVDAVDGHHAELRLVNFGQVFNFNNQEVHRGGKGSGYVFQSIAPDYPAVGQSALARQGKDF